jgi:hypothetical protein
MGTHQQWKNKFGNIDLRRNRLIKQDFLIMEELLFSCTNIFRKKNMN